MARQVIDTTTDHGSYKGDPAKIAFDKANANFAELYGSGKNLVINGGLHWWQRGTTRAASSVADFLADRFGFAAAGTTIAASRIGREGLPSPDALPSGVAAGLRIQVASGAGAANYAVARTRLEDVRQLSGKKVTLSFYGFCESGTFKVGFEASQLFGAGGSAEVTEAAKQSFTLTASPQRFTFTFTLPSVVGKTVGDRSSTSLNWWLDAGSNFASRASAAGQKSGAVRIWGIQLEEGEYASEFEWRSPALELLLCQRYCYEMRLPAGTAFAPVFRLSATSIIGWLDTSVDMATVPAVRLASGQIGFSDGAAVTSVSLTPASNRRVAIVGNVASGTAGSSSYITGLVSDPARLLFDAEI
ncbi:hypothetical protein [Stenotrophomonas maltophilia group sp. Smal13]|uniref:hypothetical protein n=1 Tax=Stenotrophomonas maltophilia group sp. Smal13 TaxID=3377166 RepID=UPI001311A5B3|nr:hypothetical protein [Stenotrophomonas maltophilia]